MKVLGHKAFPLFRIISLGFSEVELLGQRVWTFLRLLTHIAKLLYKRIKLVCIPASRVSGCYPAAFWSSWLLILQMRKPKGRDLERVVIQGHTSNSGAEVILEPKSTGSHLRFLNSASTPILITFPFFVLCPSLSSVGQREHISPLLLNHVCCPSCRCTVESVWVSRI